MGDRMNKFINLLGFGNDEEDDFDENNYLDSKYTEKYGNTEKFEDLKDDTDKIVKDDFFSRKKSKVVNLPNASQVKVVILQPSSFEQSQEICEHLKEKKSIIVNLEFVDKDIARRIIDFVSGAVYGLDGNISKVSNSIFLIAPFNYEITNEMAREELKTKLGVSWIK
ncbi:MAG: cell division protein SepF [Clostridia bacterium]|nr:cell division protein SepF [Clostridia bacterium]